MRMTFIIIGIVLLALTLLGWNVIKGSATYSPSKSAVDFYSLSCKTLGGEDYSFSQLKGKKVLIICTMTKTKTSVTMSSIVRMQWKGLYLSGRKSIML